MTDYHTADGIAEWARTCGFQRHQDAWEALGCNWRSWYRWLHKGLPPGFQGQLIAEKMRRIESARRGAHGERNGNAQGNG